MLKYPSRCSTWSEWTLTPRMCLHHHKMQLKGAWNWVDLSYFLKKTLSFDQSTTSARPEMAKMSQICQIFANLISLPVGEEKEKPIKEGYIPFFAASAVIQFYDEVTKRWKKSGQIYFRVLSQTRGIRKFRENSHLIATKKTDFGWFWPAAQGCLGTWTPSAPRWSRRRPRTRTGLAWFPPVKWKMI